MEAQIRYLSDIRRLLDYLRARQQGYGQPARRWTASPSPLLGLAAVSGATAFAFTGVFASQLASLVLQPPWPLQAWVPLSAGAWRETSASERALGRPTPCKE
jgi:hypothetical protein